MSKLDEAKQLADYEPSGLTLDQCKLLFNQKDDYYWRLVGEELLRRFRVLVSQPEKQDGRQRTDSVP